MEVVRTDDERAREIVLKYDPNFAQGDNYRLKMIFERCRSEIDEYLWAADYIIQQFMQTGGSLEAGTVRRQLLDEFEAMLNHALSTKQTATANPSSYSCTTRSYSLGFCIENDPTSSTLVLDDLRSIARRLRSMGCLHDCKEIYSAIRETFFDATLTRFGIAKLSAVDVQRMMWQELEMMIGLWVRAAPFHVHLINMETHACKSIFKVEGAFLAQIVRAYVTPFLDFVSAVAGGRRSPERLFGMLDLHGCLTSMLPPLELLKMETQAKEGLSVVEDAARETFLGFERAVVGDLSCVSNVREGVHQLTTYVMDYLTRMVSGYGKWEWIVARNIDDGDILWIGDTFSGKTSVQCSDQTPLASHIKLVIANLLCNLRSKTKQGEMDDGFACFFMMVNLNHVVQKLNKHTELLKAVGDDFKACLDNALQSTVSAHLSSTWDRVLKGLAQRSVGKKIKFLGVSFSCACRSSKEILKDFNAAFERIHETQSRWVVRDAELREGIRQCILNRLLPAYDSFLHQLSQCRSSRNATRLIKYSVEDVENAVCCQLFEGRPPSPFRSK